MENINILAENYPDLLPLIFGKWKFFQEHDLIEYIAERLKKAVSDLSNPLLFLPKEYKKSEILHSKSPIKGRHSTKMKNILKQFELAIEKFDDAYMDLNRQTIRRKVLLDVTDKELFNFLKNAYEDADIRSFITSELEKMGQEYENYLKNVKSWIQWWKNISTVNGKSR